MEWEKPEIVEHECCEKQVLLERYWDTRYAEACADVVAWSDAEWNIILEPEIEILSHPKPLEPDENRNLRLTSSVIYDIFK